MFTRTDRSRAEDFAADRMLQMKYSLRSSMKGAFPGRATAVVINGWIFSLKNFLTNLRCSLLSLWLFSSLMPFSSNAGNKVSR